MVRRWLRQANRLLGGLVGFLGGLLGGGLLGAMLIGILLPLFKVAANEHAWFAALPIAPDLIVWVLAALLMVLSTLTTMRALYHGGLWDGIDDILDRAPRQPD
jgi:hypothetical protein